LALREAREGEQLAACLFQAGGGRRTFQPPFADEGLGKTAIHFLVISIVVFGVGILIVWTQLGKKGNSKTPERLDLLERFLKLVPAHRIKVFLADRTFIGNPMRVFARDSRQNYIVTSMTKVPSLIHSGAPLIFMICLKIYLYSPECIRLSRWWGATWSPRRRIFNSSGFFDLGRFGYSHSVAIAKECYELQHLGRERPMSATG
jgi:hypothetical protein